MHSYAGPLYPQVPERALPTIRVLPKHGNIILDVQSAVLSGDPISPGNNVGIEVGVVDLSSRSESIWNLPREIPLRVSLSCNTCSTRASWAPTAKQLLLATKDGAYVINEEGRYKKLALKMPGVKVRYRDADKFAISNDGLFVAFKLYTRDWGDKYPDVNDPYAATGGKLYNRLMFEKTRGSYPRTIAKSELHFAANGEAYGKYVSLPAWSPTRRRFAYSYYKTRADNSSSSVGITVADISRRGIISTESAEIAPAHRLGEDTIEELRWSPNGKELAFIVREIWYENSNRFGKYTLYTLDADGHNLRAVRFRNNEDINVDAFAWSPSGLMFALRSNYEAKKVCNFSLMFYIQTGEQPCRVSDNLFTSNVDGTGLKRIPGLATFRHSELFWIR